MSAKINQFISVTGANVDTARKFLNACAGNLELAIGMYMEDGEQSPGAGASNVDRSPISIPLVIMFYILRLGDIFFVSIEMKMKLGRQFYQYEVYWLKTNLLQVNCDK